MRKLWILYFILWGAVLGTVSAQENPKSDEFKLKANLEPIETGIRFDDNVYRSVMDTGKYSDGIGSVSAGGVVRAGYDIFKANLGYHFADDQYWFYTILNNYKNDFDFFVAMTPGDFNLYYKKEYFLRNSPYSVFNYFDDDTWVGMRWSSAGFWNYEVQYKNLARQYYDTNPVIWSRNFVDQSGLLSVQRELEDQFSLKLRGSYNNRQFNRYAVASNNGVLVSLPNLQTDDTWTLLLNTHLYFASILQDINIEGQRTDSNGYGFSNWVESASWAGVIRPSSSFYLQLFFRIYFKQYDLDPLKLPDLQLGFIDEDSQDLLSARANWEFAPQWVGSMSLSRIRSESDQPGAYYIKNMAAFQIRISF
jgi:hypothetical protein